MLMRCHTAVYVLFLCIEKRVRWQLTVGGWSQVRNLTILGADDLWSRTEPAVGSIECGLIDPGQTPKLKLKDALLNSV